jgi:hypothetical protein
MVQALGRWTVGNASDHHGEDYQQDVMRRGLRGRL